MTSFRGFHKECLRQDVELHDYVLDAGYRGRSSLSHTAEPNGLYAAVSEAGYCLRENAGLQLANKCLEPMRSEKNPVAGFLRAIINASIAPVTAQGKELAFVCHGAQQLDTCFGADRLFVEVIEQMRNPFVPVLGYRAGYTGYQILRSNEGQAVGVRKAIGAPSTLFFETAVINGVPYPPGSIMRLENAADDWSNGYLRIRSDVQSSLRVESTSSIGFMRLGAFAVPPEQRRRDFLRKRQYHTDEGREIMTRFTIEEVQRIAQAALSSGLIAGEQSAA
jgi:hypothetical protein